VTILDFLSTTHEEHSRRDIFETFLGDSISIEIHILREYSIIFQSEIVLELVLSIGAFL